jgi:pyruvate kinase
VNDEPPESPEGGRARDGERAAPQDETTHLEFSPSLYAPFVQHGADLEALRTHLRRLGKPDLGIILKIETRRAFENLPELLFGAMAGKAAGVMIARGDLAVECGYERLAEVQEEILWATEAAPGCFASRITPLVSRSRRLTRCMVSMPRHSRTAPTSEDQGPFIDG